MSRIVIVEEALIRTVRVILVTRLGVDCAIPRLEILLKVRGMPILRDVSDRQVRAAIEELRKEGMLICNLMDGDGYYIAGSMAEYQEFRHKYVAYATTIFDRVRAMDATAENTWGSSALQGRLL